ncbi:MAG: hypothetical protein QF412_14795 [Planctomycetota bacterium]|nr:hypothetical protein [Planctomycetota bacterium]
MAPARYETCPHCGSRFKASRPACPDCGSDANTGWRDPEDLDYLSVELPDDLHDPTLGGKGLGWPARILITLMIAAMIALVLTGGF